MKKFLILLVASLVAVSGVSAASLIIGGSVTENVTATLTDATMALTFDGAGGAAGGDAAGALKVVSNKKNWTISFTSANAGVLTNGKSGDELSTIDYKLAVAITSADFGPGTVFVNNLSTAVQLTSAKSIVATKNAKTTKLGSSMALTASVAAQEDTALLWDSKYTYSDTVTIEIAAN